MNLSHWVYYKKGFVGFKISPCQQWYFAKFDYCYILQNIGWIIQWKGLLFKNKNLPIYLSVNLAHQISSSHMKLRLDTLKFSNPVSFGNIKLFLRLCQEIASHLYDRIHQLHKYLWWLQSFEATHAAFVYWRWWWVHRQHWFKQSIWLSFSSYTTKSAIWEL